MKKKFLSSQSGFALITAVTLSWMLFAATTAYYLLILSEVRQIQSSRNGLRAAALAEAGLESALWAYNYGGGVNGWAGTTTKSQTQNSIDDADGVSIGGYSVQISNWNSTTPLVASTGTLDSGTTNTQAIVRAQLRSRPLFSGGITANGQVGFIGNASTDSYNSSLGAYNANLGGGVYNVGQNGDVTTNSTSAGAISLGSNTHLYGDANTGQGGDRNKFE